MLNKSFIKISFVSAGNLFNAGLGFLFIAAVAKLFPLETFGKYVLLTSLLVAVAKIMDFGSNSVFVAKSIVKDENILSKFLSLRILLFLITIPISTAILAFFKLLTPEILIIYFAGLVAYGFNFTFFAIFQRIERFDYAILINTLPALIKGILACGILFGVYKPTFEQALWIFSGAMFTSLFFITKIPAEFKKFKIKLKETKDLFIETTPAGFNLLINDGWSTISNGIAKLYGTFSDVGIFSIADKISSIFSLVSLSIFTVILPKNAQRKKRNLAYDFRETLIISLLIFSLAVAAIFTAQIFITKFFEGKFESSLGIIDLLIFSSALTAIYSFMRDYFFVEEKTSNLLSISVARLVAFIIFSLLLVPTLSLKGLALANAGSSILALLITILLIYRHKRSY